MRAPSLRRDALRRDVVGSAATAAQRDDLAVAEGRPGRRAQHVAEAVHAGSEIGVIDDPVDAAQGRAGAGPGGGRSKRGGV